MSTGRFAKPAMDQYSDLFMRRFDADKQNEVLADSPIQTTSTTTILKVVRDRFVLAWLWIDRKRTQQVALRKLRISETISLGEKRFISILEVNGTQYLIGGATNQITLLAVIDERTKHSTPVDQGHPKGGNA